MTQLPNENHNTPFQQMIKRSRRKYIIITILLSLFSAALLIYSIITGSRFIIEEKRDNYKEMYGVVQGANVTSYSERYNYNLFSIDVITTYHKQLGDQYIVWDKTTTSIPAVGEIKMIDNESGLINIDAKTSEKRNIKHNNFSNQKVASFYYPNISYETLPKDLDKAVKMDPNKIIEVALSFNRPITITKLIEAFGEQNKTVKWLWVNNVSNSELKQLEEGNNGGDSKTVSATDAYGVRVNFPTYPYSEEISDIHLGEFSNYLIYKKDEKELEKIFETTKHNMKNGEITLNGAIVTGTPKELEKYKNVPFIRSSVIGAAIEQN
ncbi:hypothetical protein BN1058_01474 [Paraliobacillus sp. PM-2]|uniref:anti sigma factor C-terminal domain-containing protein n=1 Tax=Paraliobacillus sp. PM-2 TaxID=1462524 RepID=UPI00061C8B17|nr:anti sigma factor C-terminal domain-containing protein [Paraliobacillus sp. PM-2]CQR47183.1 hypothetical protein BN1058_01474 [Paraliobacillus sp. PM-2]